MCLLSYHHKLLEIWLCCSRNKFLNSRCFLCFEAWEQNQENRSNIAGGGGGGEEEGEETETNRGFSWFSFFVLAVEAIFLRLSFIRFARLLRREELSFSAVSFPGRGPLHQLSIKSENFLPKTRRQRNPEFFVLGFENPVARSRRWSIGDSTKARICCQCYNCKCSFFLPCFPCVPKSYCLHANGLLHLWPNHNYHVWNFHHPVSSTRIWKWL